MNTNVVDAKWIQNGLTPIFIGPVVLIGGFLRNQSMLNSIYNGRTMTTTLPNVNWQIQSSTVANSNSCFVDNRNNTPLTASNYSYTTTPGLSITTDGTFYLTPPGTYKITFGFTNKASEGAGGGLVYMIVNKDFNNASNTYTNKSSYTMRKDICTIDATYWTTTWYNVNIKQGVPINFYVADVYNNSNTYPTYKGFITFSY